MSRTELEARLARTLQYVDALERDGHWAREEDGE